MNLEPLSEQMKNVSSFILSLLLMFKWYSSQHAEKETKVYKKMDSDNYLQLNEWG